MKRMGEEENGRKGEWKGKKGEIKSVLIREIRGKKRK